MRTFFVETWGCQMNQHDSELIEGQLRRHGLSPARRADLADLVVLNTCSVRDKPVQKILSRIGAIARTNPDTLIGVCGCVAEQEGEALLDRSPSVRFVLGPGQNDRIGDAVRAVTEGRRPVLTGFDTRTEPGERPVFRNSSTRGMVTVIEGCNEFCTFCIVPYTRGREVSRPLNTILDEVRGLVGDGVPEVELLGQTINAYRCPETGADLAVLLERVAAVPGLLRVRFITSHPRHFHQPLIDVIASHPTIFSYLHLPIQSGSDAILKRMHRRYTSAEYRDLVDRIRSAAPDINLSTDIIVGFPGETEDDFNHTIEVLEAVRFGQVYGFGFSPRPGTPAARYRPLVPAEVVSRRLQHLFGVADRISLELNRRLVGRRVDVLIDGRSRRDPQQWQGRGADNRVVNFAAVGDEGVGDVVDVEITRAGPHALVGVVADAPLRLPVVS